MLRNKMKIIFIFCAAVMLIGCIPDYKKESIARYHGITEKDGEKYMCTIILTGSSVIFTVIPVSVNPDGYESFIERMNEG